MFLASRSIQPIPNLMPTQPHFTTIRQLMRLLAHHTLEISIGKRKQRRYMKYLVISSDCHSPAITCSIHKHQSLPFSTRRGRADACDLGAELFAYG